MGKNKFKIFLFILLCGLFLFVSANEIKAIDYQVEITSVENLVYKNKLNEVSVNGKGKVDEKEVAGNFYFLNPNETIETIGEIELEINFVPLDLDNYEIKQLTITAVVEARKVYVVFDSLIYKQYDGTTSINLPNYSYSGILDNEISVAGELKGEFEASYVGEDIPINLTGIELKGDKKDYYTLDLTNHSGRIHPLTLEKIGESATIIELDKEVIVDINYNLRIDSNTNNNLIKNKYTSYVSYKYLVYSHNNELLDIDSNFKVSMKMEESLVSKERMRAFELTSDGEYKEINYSYKDGYISFNIASTSSFILATRNIEYKLIYLFSGILGFSLIFAIIYRLKNSKIRKMSKY